MKLHPRVYLLGGVVLLLLIALGFFLFTRAKTAKVVDSCGNTAAAASASDVFEACTTVTGTVINVTGDADGTLKLRLRPDRSSRFAVNQANASNQDNSLVVVLTCTAPVNTSDSFYNSCARFNNTDQLPGINQRVSYTGTIKRNASFGWNELYPATENL